MKLNKHYLRINKLIKQNKPDNSAHGGLVLLLILNLFFGGCLMSHSNSALEKKIDDLKDRQEVQYKNIRESIYLQKIYIRETQPKEKVKEIFETLREEL